MTDSTKRVKTDSTDLFRNGITVLFEERQRFRQPWVWLILGLVNVVVVAIFAQGLYQQLYQGRPWGNNPTSDAALMAIAAIVISLTLGATLFLWFIELYVGVDREFLVIRFRPLLHKRIHIRDIIEWEACKYHPLWEYGGWGIRYSLSRRGWAYSVSGREGVRVRRTDGKEMLIGSYRAEELANALACAKAANNR
jgi:hypothetical protein